jgi:hypothetical protein
MKISIIIILIITFLFLKISAYADDTYINFNIDTAESNSYSSLSLNQAYWMSSIPVWSGSWNAKFTWKGFGFVAMKVIGVGFLSFCIYKDIKSPDPGWAQIGVPAFFIFYFGGVILDSDYSVNYIYELKKANKVPIIKISLNDKLILKPYLINLDSSNKCNPFLLKKG